ncbi:MAG TPA: hypothetical protein VGS27_29955 [Candidatus Sulfotelmatobacter sp.]|nr:hypothetical protein [Candidatus Sulfotelmatobacter sp.]
MTTRKQAATLLILTLVGLTSFLNAQTRTIAKAQVPFAFIANGTAMPAGECTIAVDVKGPLMSIRSGEQNAFAFPIPDKSPKAPKHTVLVFHRYDNRYFLVALKREGGTGYRLRISKLERELQARNVTEQVFTLLASAE